MFRKHPRNCKVCGCKYVKESDKRWHCSNHCAWGKIYKY